MLFRSRPASSPILPTGLRIYAVGDVHGEATLLLQLLRLIQADNDAREPARVLLIFLGDLIDRGPDGALLVEMFSRLAGEQVVVLKGNHEAGLIDAYEGDEGALGGWLSFGGEETLAGFGLTASEMATPAQLLSAMRARIDQGLIDWLVALPTHWQCGDYFFVHAGVRPRVRLDRQKADDLLWIREPFLSSRRDHGKVIVHGHSVEPGNPRLGSNRIGIDTGGHEHGRLTALGLEGRDQWLLQAHRARHTAVDDNIHLVAPDQPRLADPVGLPRQIEELAASIIASRPIHARLIPPVLELTAQISSRSAHSSRLRGGLGRRGQAAGLFAITLCGLGVAATFFHRRAGDRPPAITVVAELPTITPARPAISSATPAVHSEASRHRRATGRTNRSKGTATAIAHRDAAIRTPHASHEQNNRPAPKLYGADLEAALAEDRVITRQLNDGELVRLRGGHSRD